MHNLAPNLETERLFLEPVCQGDLPDIQKYFNNLNIIQYIGPVPWPYPDDGAQTWFQNICDSMKDNEVYLWAIKLKDKPDETIGVIRYGFGKDKKDNRGFWLAEPYWGQGIMKETIIRTQDFIFLELNKERIIVRNAVSNKASQRIKKSLGGELIDVVPCDKFYSGDDHEEVWQITRDKWIEIRDQI